MRHLKHQKPIDHIHAIIRICRLMIDTHTNTLDWQWLKRFSRERGDRRTDGRTDVTEYIISLASRSINMHPRLLVYSRYKTNNNLIDLLGEYLS